MLGGSGVGCNQDFIVDVRLGPLGKIGNSKEGLRILIFNSYVVSEQIVGGPVATKLGGLAILLNKRV